MNMTRTSTTDFPTEYLALALIVIIIALTLFSGLSGTLRVRLEQAVLPETARANK